MFCPNCGGNIADDAKFCNYCGTAQPQTPPVYYAEASQPAQTQTPPVYYAEASQEAQKPAKKSKKKIVGIVLLCLQGVALLGSVANGGLADMVGNLPGAHGLGELLGFFLPGIIGVILLCKKEKK